VDKNVVNAKLIVGCIHILKGMLEKHACSRLYCGKYTYITCSDQHQREHLFNCSRMGLCHDANRRSPQSFKKPSGTLTSSHASLPCFLAYMETKFDLKFSRISGRRLHDGDSVWPSFSHSYSVFASGFFDFLNSDTSR